jgi:hypothetical protein
LADFDINLTVMIRSDQLNHLSPDVTGGYGTGLQHYGNNKECQTLH